MLPFPMLKSLKNLSLFSEKTKKFMSLWYITCTTSTRRHNFHTIYPQRYWRVWYRETHIVHIVLGLSLFMLKLDWYYCFLYTFRVPSVSPSSLDIKIVPEKKDNCFNLLSDHKMYKYRHLICIVKLLENACMFLNTCTYLFHHRFLHLELPFQEHFSRSTQK